MRADPMVSSPPRPTSLWQALAVYAAGLVTGVQVALYLFDLYDDGVADPKSGLIGLTFLLVSLTLIVRRWRSRARGV